MLEPGLYRVRGKVSDSRSGLTKEVDKRVEAASAQEAAAIRATLLGAKVRETSSGRMKVGDFAKSWIESKAAVVSRYTLEGYAYALEKHVLPVLGTFYYDAVGHLDVQAMIGRWLCMKKDDGSRRYAMRSVKDWFWVFRNMTHDAMAHLDLDRDPTLRISFGEDHVAQGKQHGELKLTIEESDRLLDAMRVRRPKSYALLQTSKLTGQRFCHVSALKWSDVDWAEMLIRFRRKQVRGVVGPISKKKPVPTEIPVLPELARVLLAHGRRNGELRYPVGLDDWIFPSRKGTLKQPSSLVTAIRSSAEAAKIDKRITPHMMRYLFNDVLRLAGVDQVTRKSLTGHVTDEMTEHYSSVLLSEKRVAMARVAVKLAEGKVGSLVGMEPKTTRAA